MSKLPWFRLYHRMIDDERLRLLAFEDRWHFVAVLCLKADGLLDDERGPLWERRLAMRLGIQLRELDEVHRRLSEVGLIDANWHPVKWDELQKRSDSSAERVRKHRAEKVKQKQTPRTDDSYSNDGVTLQKRPRVEEEEDKKIEPKGSCASDEALKPEHVSEKWNEVATRLWGARTVRDLTPTRRQLVKARIAQYELSDFVAVFGKIEASPFLRGDSKGWRGCTFDWVMKRANFQKILEGNYDD